MTKASTTNARKMNARIKATRIDSIVSLMLVSRRSAALFRKQGWLPTEAPRQERAAASDCRSNFERAVSREAEATCDYGMRIDERRRKGHRDPPLTATADATVAREAASCGFS